MALRFLADHCISNSIVRALQEAGCEVLRLRDALPIESPDPVVIAKAQELNAILLSMNGDFADLVNYPPRNYEGILALQVRNHAEVVERLMSRLIAYLQAYPAKDHYRGKLFVIEVDRIRVRE
jgi:predicted nuclease of predicted toxin-antitoxin system